MSRLDTPWFAFTVGVALLAAFLSKYASVESSTVAMLLLISVVAGFIIVRYVGPRVSPGLSEFSVLFLIRPPSPLISRDLPLAIVVIRSVYTNSSLE